MIGVVITYGDDYDDDWYEDRWTLMPIHCVGGVSQPPTKMHRTVLNAPKSTFPLYSCNNLIHPSPYSTIASIETRSPVYTMACSRNAIFIPSPFGGNRHTSLSLS